MKLKSTLFLSGMALSLAFATSAQAQQSPASGTDESGKGAVLCVWNRLAEVKAVADYCETPRAPVDDAIDNAITEIETFILENTTSGITKTSLNQTKIELMADLPNRDDALAGTGGVCTGDNLGLRDSGPEAIRQMTADLLSVPREPVWNPCP